MNQHANTRSFELESDSPHQFANLCGQLDCHIKQIARHFRVNIYNQGSQFRIVGEPLQTHLAQELLTQLFEDVRQGANLTPTLVHLSLQANSANLAHAQQDDSNQLRTLKEAGSPDETVLPEKTILPKKAILPKVTIKTPKAFIKVSSVHQVQYVEHIHRHDLTFGIGPAGTGKTYLTVACAVEALTQDQVERIILVRPAVEAGEKLGFLPGDLAQKIDPYLRPLYDALYEMLGFEQVTRLIERNLIEVAPLAYMRGRTLSNAFIILDEGQNTSQEQMKMFLTRIGFGAKAVVTGDPTQTDLPRNQHSGLNHALSILKDIQEIGVTRFKGYDVVRHPLVQKIVNAYDNWNTQTNASHQIKIHEHDTKPCTPESQNKAYLQRP